MPGRSVEPPPLAFLTRQSFHPWLVVGVTCIGAFMGQRLTDAQSIRLRHQPSSVHSVASGLSCRHDSRRTASRPTTSAS